MKPLSQVEPSSSPIPPAVICGILCIVAVFGALFALMHWLRSRR